MKIVQVCPYEMARHGGVQQHIADLSAWLRSNGHEVRIIGAAGDRAPLPDVESLGHTRWITVHGTLTEISYVPRHQLRQTADSLRAWGADILHLHTPWTPLLPWQLWKAMRLPTVATFHATLPGAGQSGLLGKALRAAAGYYVRRLETIIVPSVSPLADLAQVPGRAEPVVLPPSIDLSRWFGAAHQTVKAHGAAKSVVFLGRFEARKGLAVLLDAWPEVSPRVPGLVLTVAGGGALEPLVRRAMASPQGGAIRLVSNPTPEQARRLLAEADLFVAPSLYGESFGIVLIEAMAAGAVPVAAANSGYSTVMTGPGAALLTPPGDPVALAETTVSLATDGARREKLREWGKSHAAGFDVARIGPRFLSLYEGVLGRS